MPNWGRRDFLKITQAISDNCKGSADKGKAEIDSSGRWRDQKTHSGTFHVYIGGLGRQIPLTFTAEALLRVGFLYRSGLYHPDCLFIVRFELGRATAMSTRPFHSLRTSDGIEKRIATQG